MLTLWLTFLSQVITPSSRGPPGRRYMTTSPSKSLSCEGKVPGIAENISGPSSCFRDIDESHLFFSGGRTGNPAGPDCLNPF